MDWMEWIPYARHGFDVLSDLKPLCNGIYFVRNNL
jgi:hypothetical protein